MHEMGITQSIVAIVEEQAAGRKVTRVTLEIGKLAAIMPEAIRFCFDVVAQGGALDGATLDIIEVPGRARCLDCGAEVALVEVFGRCGCGSCRLERLTGEELNIKSMEVEEI
ncbi:hydrogenase maturation nickel metallochaperone HypA [Methylocapsa polymorpha]|uniref:Hydrogenase maturation factor HypA n=1 Tax=Methylocapsa polymorpha TaxID=3080828 RepID=A0ABZ0HUS6_9HYPH|nr:hydrogenase maturation nickel metallochaperone HypA [Methylocapsa sp. RX1]